MKNRTIFGRARQGVLFAGMASLLVAGCGTHLSAESKAWAAQQSTNGSLDTLERAAKAEGSLTIFTPIVSSEILEWTRSFTGEYGIKVDVFRQASGPLATTYKTEIAAGKVQADIFETSNLDQVHGFVEDGSFARYRPQAADEYPADRTVPGYAYPLYESTGAIAWNTTTVPESTQKLLAKDPYQGLLDPALKGKIVLIDPSVGGSGMAYYANLVKHLPDRYGWDYLRKLGRQKPAVATSIQTISQEISAGAYSATIFGDDSIFGPLALSGAPVRFASTSPMNATLFYQGIAAKAPHPAAARLFAEWAQSHGGQEAMTQATGGSSVMAGWSDDRDFATELPWYRRPDEVWLDWQTDPTLTGKGLADFVAQWKQSIRGSS
jgi:ABC-type Fe3+ transport system substrate-binding protein